MAKIKLIGLDNGKHVVEYPDGRRAFLTDEELEAETGKGPRRPSAENSLGRLGKLIADFESEQTFIVFERDNPDKLAVAVEGDDLLKAFLDRQAEKLGYVLTKPAELEELKAKAEAAEQKKDAEKPFVATIDGLSDAQVAALTEAGFTEKEKLTEAKDEDLLKLPKVGEKAVEAIRKALEA